MNKRHVNQKIREVCEKALQKAIPTAEERQRTTRFSAKLAERLQKKLEEAGLEAKAQVEGSIAKDTWLAGEKDIDMFILVSQTEGREGFEKVLEVAKKVAGENFLEAYAEHPYIQAEIDGFTVDFVPCFKLESADKVVSSVDRTPFHTLYVKSRITEKTKNEVRLLKRFMRGIGTYGAEIKIGGFSGYLCEILILYYKSFVNLLTAASDWRKQEIIDLEGYYTNREEDARKLFQEPLIVVDPVDKSRNVASAVKEERLSEFIAAARQFLKNPSFRFFYPEPVKPLPVEEIIRTMDARGTSLVFLKTVAVRAVPDVLWGQLYRSQRAIAKIIRRYGFSLLRDDVWSDEKTAIVFVFELHSRFLPTVEKHLGPPVQKREDCERFLTKHLGSNLTLSGPRIEGDRWVVERKRRFTDVVELLKTNLENEASNTGIASQISKAFLSQLEVWVNHEVKHFYLTNPSFALFLTEYLRGKPRWLQ